MKLDLQGVGMDMLQARKLVHRLVLTASAAVVVCTNAWGAGPTPDGEESADGLQVLHRFSETAYPRYGLVQASDGAFYGTTYNMGGKYNLGSVFRITVDSFKTVHSFDGDDGYGIGGPLTQASDGYLYGVTDRGGDFAAGTAYRLSLDGKFRVLFSFGDQSRTATPARTPQTRMIEGPDGTLYGTTLLGGNARSGDYGTIFRLTPKGKFSVLHHLRDNDGDPKGKREGRYPSAGLALAADGSFVGCTSQGGPNGGGTVFRLAVDGTFTVLHAFEGIAGSSYCYGDLLIDGANIFGTTMGGGDFGGGMLFRLSLAGDEFQVLHSFELDTGDGNSPMGGLTKGPDGALYGTTYTGGGGYFNGGTVFRCTPTGDLTILHSFGQWHDDGMIHDAALINGGLLMGADGYLYGTSVGGRQGTGGTVFRLPP